MRQLRPPLLTDDGKSKLKQLPSQAHKRQELLLLVKTSSKRATK
jgi:hypothetical protein